MTIIFPDPINHCARYVDAWLPGAMFPSEIAWFLHHFVASGADSLIECGRQDGVSTEIFADYFKDTGVKVISIDFDRDGARAAAARRRLTKYDVELVAGDIHVEVPKILKNTGARQPAILQDGPKGWEGLATLLAAAVTPSVRLVAQHNLHKGHQSRSLFQHIALRPCFIENSQHWGKYKDLINLEHQTIARMTPNRPTNHTSLGVMITDDAQKDFIRESFVSLKSFYGPWNPKESRRRGRMRTSLALKKSEIGFA
ncbi:MAG: hypothetical protein IPH01_05045 [Elusimicrobia bacterium]|nr:hypothetical protein [Elusimicrobiota bacterium]